MTHAIIGDTEQGMRHCLLTELLLIAMVLLMDVVTTSTTAAPRKSNGTYFINVNQKGRMTLPVKLRKLLDVNGDSIIVVNVTSGHVAIEGRLPTVAETAGVVTPLDPPKSDKEISEIVQEEVAERYLEQSQQ